MEKKYYIVQIEPLDGEMVTREQSSEWSGPEGCNIFVVIAADDNGAEVIDDGYRSAWEAKQAWPEAITVKHG